MQLILLSKDRGQLGNVRLTSGRVWLGLVAVTLLVAASAFYGGITAARAFGISNPQAQVDTWREELAQQQAIVDSTRRRAEYSTGFTRCSENPAACARCLSDACPYPVIATRRIASHLESRIRRATS